MGYKTSVSYADIIVSFTPNGTKIDAGILSISIELAPANLLKSADNIEYVPLQYISSNGTQYIDTGVVYKTAPKVLTNAKILTNEDKDILGTSTVSSSCFIVDYYCGDNGVFARYGCTDARLYRSIPKLNEWFSAEYGSVWKENGISKTTFTSYDFSANTESICLFKARTFGSVSLMDTKIYDGETLLRDFVPCYKKGESSTIGMFDKVTKKFYGNSGSGNFALPKD